MSLQLDPETKKEIRLMNFRHYSTAFVVVSSMVMAILLVTWLSSEAKATTYLYLMTLFGAAAFAFLMRLGWYSYCLGRTSKNGYGLIAYLTCIGSTLFVSLLVSALLSQIGIGIEKTVWIAVAVFLALCLPGLWGLSLGPLYSKESEELLLMKSRDVDN